VRYLIEWFCSFFPTRLPIGMTAFEKWATTVIRLSGCPDNRSTRFSLSVMIMHGKKARVPKRFYALQLYKAAANEVAHAVAQEVKAQQKADDEAAKAQLQSGKAAAAEPPPVEAPTAKEVGGDVQTQADGGGVPAPQTAVVREAS